MVASSGEIFTLFLGEEDLCVSLFGTSVSPSSRRTTTSSVAANKVVRSIASSSDSCCLGNSDVNNPLAFLLNFILTFPSRMR